MHKENITDKIITQRVRDGRAKSVIRSLYWLYNIRPKINIRFRPGLTPRLDISRREESWISEILDVRIRAKIIIIALLQQIVS